jgi:hypothetical protein
MPITMSKGQPKRTNTMGMAASQARLLTITARMHDIEYQAQSIQNAKIALATQSDEVYQEYLEALNATTLTVKDYQGNLITANFNNLCGINAVASQYNYALLDEKGRLIVSSDVSKGYNSFIHQCPQGDAYEFAMFMLGLYSTGKEESAFDDFDIEYCEAFDKKVEDIKNGTTEKDSDLRDLWEQIENLAAENGIKIDGASQLYKTDEDKNLDAMITKFNYQVMQRYSEEIYNTIANSKSMNDNNVFGNEYDEDKFNYYANIFKQIQANGGTCVSISNVTSISKFDGFDGDAANDSEWLQKMIQSGKITVDHVNYDKKNGTVSFASTGVPSDSVLEYTTTSTIDKTALSKAEAEYEHKTKELDRKDKKFDLDLSKLDTQRTALKTEYESVKKVISENIDRTFGIFS